MDRVILHADCNCFFASVEMVKNPKLRNVPMAVAGSSEKRHGIILAKNDLAKKYNIVTAETILSAKKKCKNLVIVEPHYYEYVKYSKMILDIYKEYTDLIEPFGLDEAWLDVTASQKLFGSGEKIANELRKRIKETLGLTISVGVSFNKVFAKLGSDYKKPDATTIISRENFKSIVYPLKVSELLFCGKTSTKILNECGIYTICDLANSNKEFLVKKLGRIGENLYQYAIGNDESKVSSIYEKRELKSISHDITFEKDLLGLDEIKVGVSLVSEEVGTRLRGIGKKAFTVHVGIKNKNLKVSSRQLTLKQPINVTSDIIKISNDIIKSFWNINEPVRMISIALSNLVPDDYVCNRQISLFDNKDSKDNKETLKKEKLDKTVDLIRNKYGSSSLIRANLLKNNLYNKNI